MAIVKRTLMGLGSIAVLALLMALVVPKARAVVETLVQVANTTSNPVPNLDTERNARIPYQSVPGCNVNPSYTISCTANFTPVPSGYRLHEQYVNANAYLAAGATTLSGYLGINGSLARALTFIGTVAPARAIRASFRS